MEAHAAEIWRFGLEFLALPATLTTALRVAPWGEKRYDLMSGIMTVYGCLRRHALDDVDYRIKTVRQIESALMICSQASPWYRQPLIVVGAYLREADDALAEQRLLTWLHICAGSIIHHQDMIAEWLQGPIALNSRQRK